MVSTDKPVYRPGDAIRIRSLSLRRPDLKPMAGGKITLSVTDPKGNVIFRRGDVTSRYGIASADCPLADEILLGTYRIECQIGDTTSASAVEVKKYVLPKFKVTLDADRPYYQPGETISGTIRADYFFGKPVADAAVRIELASAKDGRKSRPMLPAARTDKSGKAAFSIRIPASLAQAAEAREEAPFNMTATVVDSAGQTESRTISRVVTASPLRIEVIPESGRLGPGRLECRVSHDHVRRRPAGGHATGRQRVRSRNCHVRSRRGDRRIQARDGQRAARLRGRSVRPIGRAFPAAKRSSCPSAAGVTTFSCEPIGPSTRAARRCTSPRLAAEASRC